MLNGIAPDILHSEGRVYGGGLQKIEPKELLNVDVPFLDENRKNPVGLWLNG
jgi:hypothetical protein